AFGEAEHVLGIELACSVRGFARLRLRGRNGAEHHSQDDRSESGPWQRLAQLRGDRRPAMENHDAPSLSESKRMRGLDGRSSTIRSATRISAVVRAEWDPRR